MWRTNLVPGTGQATGELPAAGSGFSLWSSGFDWYKALEIRRSLGGRAARVFGGDVVKSSR